MLVKLSRDSAKNASLSPASQLTIPPHMMCDCSSSCWPNWVSPQIIVYQRAVQANNVELISRVIWQSVTPLLELFRGDKGRHSGVWLAPHVWPATMLDHLGGFSGERNFYFNAELQPQTESAPLMNCQIGIKNIFILRDKSLEGEKIIFSRGPTFFWQWWGDIPHQHKGGWDF